MLFRKGLVLLSVAVGIAGCETDELTVPAFSFEKGWEGWAPQGLDLGSPPVQWSIDRTTVEAYDGVTSVRMTLDNDNADAKIWIEREFLLDAGTNYRVDVSFAFGTFDPAGAPLWRLIAGAHTAAPRTGSALTYQGDTSNGTGSSDLQWVRKSYNFSVASGNDGKVFVVVGVWGTHDESRVYYVDDLQVVFSAG